MVEMSWLESEGLGPKNLKTGEDQGIMDMELEIYNHCKVGT